MYFFFKGCRGRWGRREERKVSFSILLYYYTSPPSPSPSTSTLAAGRRDLVILVCGARGLPAAAGGMRAVCPVYRNNDDGDEYGWI